MNRQISCMAVSMAVWCAAAAAQTIDRRADIRGGNPGEGKCVVEVLVDGAAQVEVRGDRGSMRDLQGQEPQWRRFECSSPLPRDPQGFRFVPVSGRGSQRVIAEPRGDGAAVVEIRDPQNGAGTYVFELAWSEERRPDISDRDRGRDEDRGGRRFAADEAVRFCQDEVGRQAAERFRAADVRFRRINVDDAPGRNEWVVGIIEIRRRDRPDQVARFSCSVDFDGRRMREARIEEPYTDDGRDRR